MTQPRLTTTDGRGRLPGSDGELPHPEPSPAVIHGSRQDTGLPASETAQVTSHPAPKSSRRPAMTDVPPDIVELMRHGDEQLEELVLANLGPDAVGLWDVLIAPPLLGRVRKILIATEHRVENDLRVWRSRRDERRSRLGHHSTSLAEQSYDDWRARVTVFKRLVEARLAQTRVAAADENHKAVSLNRGHRDTVRRLAGAIECHRRALVASFAPTPADRALWHILDDVTVPMGPHGIPVSVRDMLDVHWSPEENYPNVPVLQHRKPAEHGEEGTAMDVDDIGSNARSTTETPEPWPKELEKFADAVRPTTKPNQDTDGKN